MDVRFGSKADVGSPAIDVRFTPKSRHRLSALGCPLCATSKRPRVCRASPRTYCFFFAELFPRLSHRICLKASVLGDLAPLHAMSALHSKQTSAEPIILNADLCPGSHVSRAKWCSTGFEGSCALINIQTKLGATGRDSRCNSLVGKDSEF